MHKSKLLGFLIAALPVAALVACSEQEPAGPAASEANPEMNELSNAGLVTSWKVGDYWCMSFDGDRGTMKLKMTVRDTGVNNVTGTVDWKRREDNILFGGRVSGTGANQALGFSLRTNTKLLNRRFTAFRKAGNTNTLVGESFDVNTWTNRKLWSATRGACK